MNFLISVEINKKHGNSQVWWNQGERRRDFLVWINYFGGDFEISIYAFVSNLTILNLTILSFSKQFKQKVFASIALYIFRLFN